MAIMGIQKLTAGLVLSVALSIVLSLAPPVAAQVSPAPPLTRDAAAVAERAARLDQLFTELAAADLADPEPLQNEIAAIWSLSGSPSVDLLLRRGRDAMNDGDLDKAIELYEAIVARLRP